MAFGRIEMKRITAALIAMAMVLAFASCGKRQEPSTAVSIQTESQAATESAKPSETTAPAPTVKQIGPLSDYVKDARDKYKHLEGKKEAGYCPYHVPEILIDSAYAESVNKEIADIFGEYEAEIKKTGSCHYFATEYIAYLTKDGILSVVFVEDGEVDDNVFHVYNINVKTGDKVDNLSLAETAGVKDIRTAAMNAVQAFYNNSGMIEIENYKVVKKNGKKLDDMEKEVERSFIEERLNDKMMIGITNEGKLFFISALGSFGGADWYFQMYDVDGVDLYNSQTSNWVSSLDCGGEE